MSVEARRPMVERAFSDLARAFQTAAEQNKTTVTFSYVQDGAPSILYNLDGRITVHGIPVNDLMQRLQAGGYEPKKLWWGSRIRVTL